MHSSDRRKRSIDLVVATILLLIVLPIILLTAVASAVTLRSWPFFVQQRIGRHGVPFRFVKVRTLPPSFAKYAAKPAVNNVHLPRAMRWLRRTHLDELPQLWLVVIGKMSLVGPRPEMSMLHDRLDPRAAAERTSVRPGVTGLWQVSAHCDALICDHVEYDRLYVRYANLPLDLWILAKTVQKMFAGQRVHLFEVPTWAIGTERPVATAVTSTVEAVDIVTSAGTEHVPVPLPVD